MHNKIVVFTGNLSYSVRKGIVDIDRTIEGLSWLILHHAPTKTPARLLGNQWRNLRRNGWRWLPYQGQDLWQRLRADRPANPLPGQVMSAPGQAYTLATLRAQSNIQLLTVNDIHSSESIAAVQAFSPDLGLSLAAPILRPSLFSIPTTSAMTS